MQKHQYLNIKTTRSTGIQVVPGQYVAVLNNSTYTWENFVTKRHQNEFYKNQLHKVLVLKSIYTHLLEIKQKTLRGTELEKVFSVSAI